MTLEEQRELARIAAQMLDLQRVLAEQERQTRELSSAILRLSSSQPSAAPAGHSHTATARAREFARANPSRVLTLANFMAAMPEVGEQTVRATVGRLCRDDNEPLEYVDHGRYRYSGSAEGAEDRGTTASGANRPTRSTRSSNSRSSIHRT